MCAFLCAMFVTNLDGLILRMTLVVKVIVAPLTHIINNLNSILFPHQKNSNITSFLVVTAIVIIKILRISSFQPHNFITIITSL